MGPACKSTTAEAAACSALHLNLRWVKQLMQEDAKASAADMQTCIKPTSLYGCTMRH